MTIPAMREYRNVSAPDLATAKSMLARGYSLRDIANHTGCASWDIDLALWRDLGARRTRHRPA